MVGYADLADETKITVDEFQVGTDQVFLITNMMNDRIEYRLEREFITQFGLIATFTCCGEEFEIDTVTNTEEMIHKLYSTRTNKKAPNLRDIDDENRVYRRN
uniref:BPH_2 domain-containing protein n=1 Tax=Caenorhabditis tropicalis TaxID=1561998 RepID=A0A1I7U6Z1_9PELO